MGAPIVVFAYRRPEHLRRTLLSLTRCEGFADSQIIVYCDGPKNDQIRPCVEATRDVARQILGDRAEYRFSADNLGLSRSIIRGVTEVAKQFGRAIVVEDDLDLAPDFIMYMNRALDRYANEPAVAQVSGFMFDAPEIASRSEALFLPVTVSWGWATWQRAWEAFDPEARGWENLRLDKDLRLRFNLEGAYDYASALEDQMAGHSDSWAVRWYWTVFREGGLVLFPPRSLVNNTGMDGSGTHGRGRLTKFGVERAGAALYPIEMPSHIGIDEAVFACVRAAVWRQNGGVFAKVRAWFRQLLRLLQGARGSRL